MAEAREWSTKRIQVGIIGLVVVLLFVSLANMVLDSASDEPATSQLSNTQAEDVAAEAKPGEPLAELGVTPVAIEETKPVGASGTNARPAAKQPR